MNPMSGLFTKHFWKFFLGLLGMIAVGFLVIYATNFYNYWSENRAAQNAEAEIQRSLKNR